MLVSIFLLTSCIAYKQLEFKGIEDVLVNEFSQKGIDVEIKANIYNPNGYNIKIVGSELDFYVAGTKIGCADIDNNIVIKKKLEKTYAIRLKADPSQIKLGLTTMLGILFTQKANVRVKGLIKAKALGVSKNVPVDFEQSIGL
jgi:LEA14-like dessication related protein